MFRISVSTGRDEPGFTLDESYRMIKEAGFDAVDAGTSALYTWQDIFKANPSPAFSCSDKETVSYFLPWRDMSRKYGIENYQCHAPYPTLIIEPESQNEYMMEVLRKSIIGCDAIDCRNLIIHPFFYPYRKHISAEEEKAINIERYSKLIPTAKQYGVTICIENIYTEYRGRIYHSCCSNIDTACDYVDTLNEIAGEKCFGFCLDTGHLLLLGVDVRIAMQKLGDRIVAFHVHDNNGISDQHVLPYNGVQDWDRFIAGLKDIQFSKTLSFETTAWRSLPRELNATALRLLAETGRMFDARAQL